MKRLLLVVCTLAMGALLPAAVQADWADNFDSYANGTNLHNVGGWEGWEGAPGAGALVANRYSHTAPNSVAITGASDLVHPYAGYTSGQWTYTAWQYIPANFTGASYFILLSGYQVGNHNWSVQVQFTGGQVVNDGNSGGVLPWITGQWVELRVEIDLDNDLQTFYYGGNVLYTGTWTAEQLGGGLPAIAAVDLYANGASPVYYDTMSLESGAVAVEHETWGNVKALFR